MAFFADGISILLGGLLGSLFNKKIAFGNYSALSIAIMLISAVGLFENILSISNGQLVGTHTVYVSLALVFGCIIGDALKIEDRLYSLSKTKSLQTNGLIESTLFFGIGGLQISGPILYVLDHNSFQLILKALIDFPFALMLGATYGKRTALSAPIVLLMQIGIAVGAYFAGAYISDTLISQLCSLGYLILFFSGFNMICAPKNKIKNINMLPGIFLIIIYNVLTEVFVR